MSRFRIGGLKKARWGDLRGCFLVGPSSSSNVKSTVCLVEGAVEAEKERGVWGPMELVRKRMSNNHADST
jgi:hypothetical protein